MYTARSHSRPYCKMGAVVNCSTNKAVKQVPRKSFDILALYKSDYYYYYYYCGKKNTTKDAQQISKGFSVNTSKMHVLKYMFYHFVQFIDI